MEKSSYDINSKFSLCQRNRAILTRGEDLVIEKESCIMYTQEITVNNEVGLHARPATFFIQKANEFKSGIWVEKEDRRVNAKSLLGVLSLGIVKGTAITLIADGADEKEAVSALIELINDNFGEE
jgi:phosphocarrier protein